MLPDVCLVPLTRGVELDLEPGDIVRGDQGLVWATAAGERNDIMLTAGETYEAPRRQCMYVSGFDGAVMQVFRMARGSAWDRPASLSSWFAGSAAVLQRWMRGA